MRARRVLRMGDGQVIDDPDPTGAPALDATTAYDNMWDTPIPPGPTSLPGLPSLTSLTSLWQKLLNYLKSLFPSTSTWIILAVILVAIAYILKKVL